MLHLRASRVLRGDRVRSRSRRRVRFMIYHLWRPRTRTSQNIPRSAPPGLSQPYLGTVAPVTLQSSDFRANANGQESRALAADVRAACGQAGAGGSRFYDALVGLAPSSSTPSNWDAVEWPDEFNPDRRIESRCGPAPVRLSARAGLRRRPATMIQGSHDPSWSFGRLRGRF